MKVLVVESDQETARQIDLFLKNSKHDVCHIPSGERLFESIEISKPDIILLDQLLPGNTGHELLKEMRARQSYGEIPVIMLASQHSINEQIKCFELGADDYIVKPFAPEVLLARMDAVLRRYHKRRTDRLVSKDLSIDFDTHKVELAGTEIPLTLTEFKILSELLRESGRVLTRDNLREKALGNLNVTDRTIDVHMASIRKKLDERGQSIQTVRGVGYRFAS